VKKTTIRRLPLQALNLSKSDLESGLESLKERGIISLYKIEPEVVTVAFDSLHAELVLAAIEGPAVIDPENYPKRKTGDKA
jgi:hypothetical protein